MDKDNERISRMLKAITGSPETRKVIGRALTRHFKMLEYNRKNSVKSIDTRKTEKYYLLYDLAGSDSVNLVHCIQENLKVPVLVVHYPVHPGIWEMKGSVHKVLEQYYEEYSYEADYGVMVVDEVDKLCMLLAKGGKEKQLVESYIYEILTLFRGRDLNGHNTNNLFLVFAGSRKNFLIFKNALLAGAKRIRENHRQENEMPQGAGYHFLDNQKIESNAETVKKVYVAVGA